MCTYTTAASFDQDDWNQSQRLGVSRMVRGMLKRRFSGIGSVGGALLLLACLVTALLVAQAGHAAGTTPGPVAAYSFDEGTGTTVADTTGHGHTATIEGAKWARGRYGDGLEFKGSEHNVVKIPASSELNFEEEFTLEAWVRPASSTDKLAPIVGKTTGGGSGSKSLSYYLYAGNSESKPYGEVQHVLGTGKKATATSAPPGATWTHLALTYDGAMERLYVNGVQVAETAAEAPVTTTGELQIGAETEHSEYFSGRIDEVQIYNRVLNGAEVDSDMETPIETSKVGPVAEYSFDEGTGTTVEDLTGHEHTATIEGAKWARGRYGDGLEFKGSEHNVVKIPASSELNFEEEFTLEAWVRPGSSTDKLAPIIGKTTGGGSGSKSLSYYLYAGNSESKPYGEIQHVLGTGKKATASSAPPGATWTHLALTYDGAKERLFVNGVQVAETATEAPVTTSGELQIGAETEHSEYFSGRIDEVRIYNRALNGAEVDSDMEAPIITPKQGPVAAYSFDEGTGTTVADVTGDGHTATIESGGWTTHGRYGGAISFDGSGGNKCVSVPDSPELRFTEEFTLEAWVRPEGGSYEDPVVVKESSGKTAFGLGLGSREEYEAEGFIGEGSGSKAAVGGEKVRDYEWAHLAATWDGSTIRLYVDGELADTETATSPPASGEGSLKIGCDGPDGQFTGQIDEVRAYNRTLTGGEVAADMEAALQTPKEAPVAAYSFDEGTGTTVADTTGDGHTATIEGAKWTEHGRYGGAMEFEAAKNDVLKIPASPELDFNKEFTLEAWVRPSGADNHSAPLIDKQEGGAHGYFLYEGGSVSDRPYGAANEDQEYIHAEDPLPANAWSHVALTFDGNRTYLYVDGEPVDNGAAEPTVTSEGELEIGGSTDTADYFDGRIDEVRIYNRALEPAEVDADMEAPIQTPKQGPVAAWSFEEGKGSTAADLTGDGHTAAIEGAEWTTGKYGGGLKFNGTSSCVSVADAPDLRLGEEFTLESWVRPEGELKHDPVVFKEGPGHLNYALEVGRISTGDAEGAIGTSSSPNHKETTGVNALQANVWNHLAVTFDGATLRLYVDGELVDSEHVEGADAAREGALKIGCDSQYGEHFKGRIDEARIYNRALSEVEVKTSMAALPAAATTEVIGVEEGEAVMIGTIDTHGLPTEYQFEYGPTRSYGTTVPEFDEEELVSDQPEEVEEVADELEPETTYHYRVVATNAAGRIAGGDQTFTTGPEVIQPEALDAEKKYPGFANMMWSGNFAKMGTKSVMNDVEGSGARMLRLVIPGIGAEIEKIFRLAAEAHVTILPYITQGFYNPTNPEWVAGWQAKVKTVVERFGKGGTFWTDNPTLPKMEPEWLEVWNEENYGPFNGNVEKVLNAEGLPTGEIVHNAEPKEFGEVLRLAHEEIAAITAPGESPRAKILVGGLLSLKRDEAEEKEVKRKPGAATPLMSPGTFIRKMGHVSDYDAVAVHPYAFAVKGKQRPKNTAGVIELTEKVKKNLKKVRAAMDWIAEKEEGETARERPIWVTEIGFPVNTDSDKVAAEDGHHLLVSEQVQAELLTHVFNMMKTESAPESEKGFDISRAFYYNIQDFVDNHHTSWDYRCGLREDDAGNYVVLNGKNEPVKKPDGEPKEAPTRENHQYRPAFFAFEKEAEITGKYP
jgi:hypothetical protein